MKKLKFVLIFVVLLSLMACKKEEGEKEMVGARDKNMIVYQGHGSLKLLLKNGKNVYVDPYAGEGYDEKADLILITHEHSDHNNIDLVKQNDDCKIIRSKDMIVDGKYLTTDIYGMNIEAVEAYNKNHKKNECVGYVLRIGNTIIYIAGDTSKTNQMKELASYGIDIAFLPMDGKFNMDIEEAKECENLIQARRTIPYHLAPGKLFDVERAKLFDTDTTCILEPNQKIEFD